MAFRTRQGRNRAVDALRVGAERFPDLFESTAVALALFDAEGTLVQVNPAFAAMLGYGEDEMAGMTIADLIPKGDFPDGADRLRELEAGTIDWFRLEGRCRRKDGTSLWCRTLVAAVRDESGRFRYNIAYVDDITEHRETEEALRESERRFRAVVDNVSIACFTVDRAGTVTYAEGKGLKKLGHEPGQRVGRSVFETYRDNPEAIDTFRRALAGEEGIFVLEAEGLVFESRYAPLRGPDGEILGVSGISIDITDRKRVEEELRESEERYRRLADVSFEGVAIHDNGRILDVNEALGRMFGYQVNELIGMHAVDLAAPESREALLRRIRSPDEKRFEVTARRNDGSTFPIELRTRAVTYRGRDARGGRARSHGTQDGGGSAAAGQRGAGGEGRAADRQGEPVLPDVPRADGPQPGGGGEGGQGDRGGAGDQPADGAQAHGQHSGQDGRRLADGGERARGSGRAAELEAVRGIARRAEGAYRIVSTSRAEYSGRAGRHDGSWCQRGANGVAGRWSCPADRLGLTGRRERRYRYRCHVVLGTSRLPKNISGADGGLLIIEVALDSERGRITDVSTTIPLPAYAALLRSVLVGCQLCEVEGCGCIGELAARLRGPLLRPTIAALACAASNAERGDGGDGSHSS